ncbi:MAG: helix-turn-helix transcriptional regulator [Pseudomonadota bacterium]
MFEALQEDPRRWAYEGVRREPDLVWADFNAYLSDLGFGSAALLHEIPQFQLSFPTDEQTYGVILCKEWQDFCRSEEGDREIHSGFTVAQASSVGLDTAVAPSELLTSSDDIPKDARYGLELASDFGLNLGLSTAVVHRESKSFSALLLCSSKDQMHVWEGHRRHINRTLAYLTEGLQVRQLQNHSDGDLLSPRELECLAWLSAGRSSKQIGDQLSLATSTVNEYVALATKKLGATNRTQAVARAMLLGLFLP